MPLLLVRHASAGKRDEWARTDRERPLDERGQAQAEGLVELLRGFTVERILSSPAVRCVETVAPLAAKRGLEPERREELAEERQETDGAALVRSLDGQNVVVCAHAGLEAIVPGFPRWRKGATLVLGPRLELLRVLGPAGSR